MPLMHPPHSTAAVNVGKDDVGRYREAGWTEAKDTKKQAPAKKSAPASDKK